MSKLVVHIAVLIFIEGCVGYKPVHIPVESPIEVGKKGHTLALEYIISDFRRSRRSRFVEKVGQLIAGEVDSEKLVTPVSIASNGKIWAVAGTGTASIWLIDAVSLKSRKITRFGGKYFQAPVGIALLSDSILVSDGALGIVVHLELDGQLLMEFDTPSRPAGIAVSADDQQMAVAFPEIHAVGIYDFSTSTEPKLYSTSSSGAELFNYPTYVAYSPNGDLLVSDTLNFRVLRFDEKMMLVQSIGGRRDEPGHFARPRGVSVDHFGNVYVVDGLFDNLQKFDREGQFVSDYSGGGHSPGLLWLPSGVATDGESRVLIADTYNNRIQVFKHVP